MCTVTYIPNSEGCIITSNRDEKITRKRAISPQEYTIEGKKITFPKDPNAGGTWIAHDLNKIIVLLNGAQEKHISKNNYRKSRGLIVLELMFSDNALDHWNTIDLTNIEPFTIVYFENNNLIQLQWNEVEKTEEVIDEKPEAVGKDERVYTRDQLLVTGFLDGEEVSIIVNHWPSRSGGEKRSSPYREAAGKLNRKIIDSLYSLNPNANIITMGDLNDDPVNKSVKKEISTVANKEDIEPLGMYNPMEKLYKSGEGTLGYRDAWNLFDQIILSEPLVRKEKYEKNDFSTWTYWKVGRFIKPYLIQNEGQWKGYPKRNSNGVPGYSDHFAVYIYLIKQAK